jgi:hypothetical protein
MNQAPVKSSSGPVKSRLGLKLTGLFVAAFAIVFVGLLFQDLLLMLEEKNKVEAAASNPQAVVAIDPKIESDLAKVLQSNDSQNTADIKNPFADATGLSGKTNTPGTLVATTNPAPNAAPVQTNASREPARNPATRTVTGSVNPEPQMDTRMRLQLREERIRLGQDGGPEALAFAVDDLLPVGAVSGGDGKDEVMFYSKTACRVFSFPVGTQFFDGWFDSLRAEGVVFGAYDQSRTMRLRQWQTSVQPGCTENLSVTPSSVRTGTTEGGE